MDDTNIIFICFLSWAWAYNHGEQRAHDKINKATTRETKTGSNLNDFLLFCIFVCTFNTSDLTFMFFLSGIWEWTKRTITTRRKAYTWREVTRFYIPITTHTDSVFHTLGFITFLCKIIHEYTYIPAFTHTTSTYTAKIQQHHHNSKPKHQPTHRFTKNAKPTTQPIQGMPHNHNTYIFSISNPQSQGCETSTPMAKHPPPTA